MHHQWHRATSAGAITGAIGALHHMHHAATKAQVPALFCVIAVGALKIPGPGGPLWFRRLKFIAINSADMLCVDPSGGTNWRAGNTVYFAVGEGPLLRITRPPCLRPGRIPCCQFRSSRRAGTCRRRALSSTDRAHIQEAVRRAQNDGAAAGGCVCRPAQCERDDGGGDECFHRLSLSAQEGTDRPWRR